MDDAKKLFEPGRLYFMRLNCTFDFSGERRTQALFLNVYRLAQQGAEAFAMFAVIQAWFKSWARDSANAIANEELFRFVASNSRRTSVIAIHILCDNGKPQTCNVYRLIQRVEISPSAKKAMLQWLKSVAPTVRKIKTLRNHIDAHLSEHDTWREGLGDGLQRKDVDRVLAIVFKVLLECVRNRHSQIRLLRQFMIQVSFTYRRMIRAMREQVVAGKVRRQIISVQDWEDQCDLRDEAEPSE